jgi:D-3-phosphoglycerate dehydrogenase
MKVLACDPQVGLPAWIGGGSIDDVCAKAEIVSLHASADAGNADMIGTNQFALMRAGCLFINTARGELVDEDALLSALRSRRLGGAALDVLKVENSDDPRYVASAEALKDYARSHGNLILTPHIAGATFESMAKTEIFIAERLIGRATAAHR